MSYLQTKPKISAPNTYILINNTSEIYLKMLYFTSKHFIASKL